MNFNPYEILGLKPPVSFSDMEKAYKKCLVSYHPDKFHHLGPEFSSLARAKLRLAHEAYTYLREGEWKQIHKGLPSFSKFRFGICPNCAHVQLTSQKTEILETCENCHGTIQLTGYKETHLRHNLRPILKFIQLSHEIEAGDQLASHLEISLNQSQITLDLLPERYWYVFTNSRSIHQYWENQFPSQTQCFDLSLQTGFAQFPLESTANLADSIGDFLNPALQQKEAKARIIPSHRKRGVAEPNAMLLSALNNISMVTASEIWELSEGNLWECRFEIVGGWEKRLSSLFNLVFSPKRKNSSPLLYSENEKERIQVYDSLTFRNRVEGLGVHKEE